MQLSERVLRTVRMRGLIGRGARIVVALSGGADSVALVHLLRDLEPRGELTLAGVAHFNHQLRGDQADADEAFCRSMAASLDLACEVGRADVRALAREQGRSIEDAARVARYSFLETAADRLGADAIGVAHTLDDQAETFLLRLIRGAGPRGLTGIRPRAGRVIRPLLDVRRAELRAFLADSAIPFREDSSNADVSIPRNRVRLELIPYLQRECSPGIVEVLAREAAIAGQDEDFLSMQSEEAARSVILGASGTDGVLELDRNALNSLHPAIAARVARIALTMRASNQFVGYDHAARLLGFVRDGKPGSAMSLPGQQAVHLGSRVALGPEPPRPGPAGTENSFRFSLSIPGEVMLHQQGWAVSVEPLDEPGWRERSWAARGDIVAVASGSLRLPLAIRGRRPGDRFRPLGLRGGGKKLQDFLVDRKVPRNARDVLPLVVDADDRIVWVVGYAVAEDFRVTEPSRGVLLLKARRLGGLG